LVDWTELFLATLLRNNNIGVTGPRENHPALLTQSFVHKSHLEIFGSYYPSSFRNWWSDDWISQVYASSHLFPLSDVVMVNTNVDNTRYKVHRVSERILSKEVMLGKEKLHEWLSNLI
jgi:hypothetical protein